VLAAGLVVELLKGMELVRTLMEKPDETLD
jgi:hypothetical protein